MPPVGRYVVLAVLMRRGKIVSYLFGSSAYLAERLSIMDTNHMYVLLHIKFLFFMVLTKIVGTDKV